MEEKKLKDTNFLKFCTLIKETLGESSIEVLYSWYYNTFDVKKLTFKDSTPTPPAEWN